MKKLIMVFLTLSLFVALNIIISTDQNYLVYLKETRYKHDIFPSKDEKFQFVGIGNSHARDSLDLNQIGGINLGLSAQSIELNFMMLKKYEDFFAENVTIIYELSHYSFFREYTSNKKNYVDLGFSHKDLDMSIEDYILTKYFPITGFESIKNFFQSISNKNPQHFANNLFDFKNEEELIENSQNYFESTYLDVSTLIDIEYIIYKNIEILIDTIQWANARNYKLVFYTSPFYKSLAENINNDNEVFNFFESIVFRLIEDFEIEYLNLNYIEIISSQFEYFRDANHLNYEGALIFTNYLISLIL